MHALMTPLPISHGQEYQLGGVLSVFFILIAWYNPNVPICAEKKPYVWVCVYWRLN